MSSQMKKRGDTREKGDIYNGKEQINYSSECIDSCFRGRLLILQELNQTSPERQILLETG